MNRWLFSFLVFALLLVYVATCALWVWSYYRCETLDWKRYTIFRESPDHRDARSFYERCWLRSNHGTIGYADLRQVAGDPRFVGNGWRTVDRRARSEFRWERQKAFPSKHSTASELSFHLLGIRFNRFTPQVLDPGDPPGRASSFEIPFAVLFSIEILFIASLFRVGLRSRKRSASVACHRCGYDLRATPGRCPEYGAASARVVGAMPNS